MINVTAIVEGYGDVAAVPQLLNLVGRLVETPIIASRPIRAGEWKRVRADGVLERFLTLAASRCSDQILVALDLEDDCCADEYAQIRERITEWDNGRGLNVGVVFFVREYETLFLTCADDIDRTLAEGYENPESRRDAKGEVRRLIGRRYKETQDQLALTRRLDPIKLTERSRTFRKLIREITGADYESISELYAG